jgi:DNA-3-methyladenine glycosylase
LAKVGRKFYERYTPNVARELLGCRLVRVVDGRRLSGIIVETEAYRGSRDPASHAFSGRTPRNEVMFGPAGHAYVYFTMGAHFCLNITTEPGGTPAAVLIRALEPVEGIMEMKVSRRLDEITRLASGPGNLTKALQIDRGLNGEDIVRSRRLFVESGPKVVRVGVSSRVGITKGTSFMWRFFAKDSPFVSRRRPSAQTGNP